MSDGALLVLRADTSVHGRVCLGLGWRRHQLLTGPSCPQWRGKNFLTGGKRSTEFAPLKFTLAVTKIHNPRKLHPMRFEKWHNFRDKRPFGLVPGGHPGMHHIQYPCVAALFIPGHDVRQQRILAVLSSLFNTITLKIIPEVLCVTRFSVFAIDCTCKCLQCANCQTYYVNLPCSLRRRCDQSPLNQSCG